MKITFLTLFPELFTSFLNTSIIKRAISNNVVEFEVKNIRDYTTDKHHRVDDYPTGGGAGLIMKCQPILDCLASCKKKNSHIIVTSPRGQTFNQGIALDLSKKDHLIFIAGHYEGIDERVLGYCDQALSIGDYILTGGELPSMVMADAITRLLKGCIADESIVDESFSTDLLEYPQYTFPYEYEGKTIPDILFSGNHQAIAKWRKKESLRLTKIHRPDLLKKYQMSKKEKELFKELESSETPKWELDAIEKGKKFKK